MESFGFLPPGFAPALLSTASLPLLPQQKGLLQEESIQTVRALSRHPLFTWVTGQWLQAPTEALLLRLPAVQAEGPPPLFGT